MPTAWRLGDRNDSRGLDWSGHPSRHKADLSTSYRSSFDRCLPSALGWIILVGMRPVLSSVDARTAVLVGVGGVLYPVGTRISPLAGAAFHNAIWHSFVLVAASCHYPAILHGVMLAVTLPRTRPLTAVIRVGLI